MALIQLNSSEITQVLRYAIREGKPALIVGPPGVGKTAVCREAAKLEGADVMVSHPALGDQTDAKGLPDLHGDHAKFKLFEMVADACRATKKTVWMLEDFGQACTAVQAAYMPWLLDGKWENHTLSPHVTFIASTNRRSDKAGVSGLLEPVKSRFTGGIYHMKSDPKDFDAVMHKLDFAPEVISFIRVAPHLLNKFEPTQDIMSYPCERTWEAVSNTLKMGMVPRNLEQAVFGAKIGEGTAIEFIAHLRLARELQDPEEIIENPLKAKIPNEESSLYCLITALAMKTTTETFKPITVYAKRLYENKPKSRAEFASLLLMDAVRKCSAVTATKAFSDLRDHDLGKFIIEATVTSKA